MNHIQKGDLAFLEGQLRKLDICVAEADNDGFIAFTTAEPLFCLERGSLEDLSVAVSGVLKSYISTFYHVDISKVSVESVDIPQASNRVPIERVNPISRLRPIFDNLDSRSNLLATV